MNLFKSLCDSCGMSHVEAATYLDIRPDTALEMWIGTREPPDGIVIQMKERFMDINNAAVNARERCGYFHPDQAVQRRIIEIMTIDDVLNNFGRIDRKDKVST